ncbi:hypothetical protein FXO38_17149 [Capsicum annuum]|uniref:Ubiquitin-like protease family profile domain-containing protein n=1 Tax=Capsicum annuum TaxID=4072 RepID=A0A2G2Z3S1_CAPAN|nr:hypothetical protein FXO37_28317 [Capsicum annuum]KAF3650452.1 hypothetical protein FXO38_17149 [Capsicum annuum]PHT76551.1 hypothetical protein T459_20073 [Capsicum annuum]
MGVVFSTELVLILWSHAPELRATIGFDLTQVEIEHQNPSGYILEFGIPTWKWDEVNMDFVMGFPYMRCQHDSIWVIVDRMTKSAHFLPVHTSYLDEDYAKIYVRELVRLHGVPLSIISDRDSGRYTNAEEHNIIVGNPSTTSKEEEKVESVSSGEWKNYLFEGFNILDKAPKKLTKLINDYSEWIVDGLLNHHAERRISVYDSMSRRKYSEIQKLAKILPTYLDMNGFLDLKVRTDWSMIEAYQDKMGNPFDVQYVEGVSQQTIGSLDCGLFVAAYAEYLSNGLQVPNDGLDVGLLHKIYDSLLWKYGEVKAQKLYASDIKNPQRPKPNFVAPDEEQLIHIK